MPLRSKSATVLLLGMLLFSSSYAQAPVAPQRPTTAEINTAVDKLLHDPSLGEKKKVRSLHWVASNDGKPPDNASGNFWLLDLFKYFSQISLILVWAAGAVAAALCIVWLARVMKSRHPGLTINEQGLPSHIRDLDVRPESLPSDIGAAARALLDAGRRREALSMLYRGALSQAIHRHSLVVLESFTEGEVLTAVKRQLNEAAAQYFAKLVSLWQREVYAADHPAADLVAKLCSDFEPALEGRP